MVSEHQNQIEQFGEQLGTLSDALTKLSNTEDLKHLQAVIKKPGWTTPAELAFALGIVESLHAQVNTLSLLRGALVKASGIVGAK